MKMVVYNSWPPLCRWMPDFIPAALLILVAQQPRLQVLIGKRASDQRSFPDHWTFPGGKLDPEDGPESELESFLSCALRETAEEVGIVIDVQAKIHDLGWRVTPPFSPKRFETRYFLHALPEAIPLGVLSPELSEAIWIEPAALLQRWQRGQVRLPPPIRGILAELAASGLDLSALKNLENDRDQLYSDLELHPGIEVIPLRTPTLLPATHTNCALIGGPQFLIVDPASPYLEEQALLQTRIAVRQARGDRPVAIVLTHHHVDHVSGARALSEALGLPIQAHAQTSALLKDQLEISQEISDGFRWQLGADPATGQSWEVEALFTPGHAPGHLCLIDLRHRVAHVGDMLAGIGTILIDPSDGDMGQYLDSLKKLEAAQLHSAIPSHGPILQDPSASCRQYYMHRLKREEKVLAALASGPLTDRALLEQVYIDTDPRAWPLARRSLQAHLLKLRQEQRVTQSGETWSLMD